MEEQLVFSTLLSSSIYVGNTCFKAYKRRQKSKQLHLFSIITARKTGISTALTRVKDYVDNDYVSVVDVEKVISANFKNIEELNHYRDTNQEVFNISIYPLVKKYIFDLHKAYPLKTIVLFTTDLELVEYLNIPKEKRLVLLPTLGFQKEILGLLDEDASKLSLESREKLLMRVSSDFSKKLYTNWNELKDILVSLFGNR